MRRWLWAVLVVVAGAFALALWLFAHSWRPSATNYPSQGVDVSDANGKIDWAAVRAAGASFAYIRATKGSDVRDSRFEENLRESQSADVVPGPMHTFSLCKLATDQANNFNTTVPDSGEMLRAAIELDFSADCDSRPGRDVVIGELKQLIASIEAHMQGRQVVLLVSRAFDAQYQVSAAFDRPVWSAQNFFPPDYAARPWRMWRASDMRRIDGVDGPVNWDVVAK